MDGLVQQCDRSRLSRDISLFVFTDNTRGYIYIYIYIYIQYVESNQ